MESVYLLLFLIGLSQVQAAPVSGELVVTFTFVV